MIKALSLALALAFAAAPSLDPRTSHLAPRTSHLAPRASHLAPRASHLAPRSSNLDPRSSSVDTIDRIMAVVAGQPVTLSDVNAARAFELVASPPPGGDPLAATLERVIERALILTDVERYQPPEPAPDAVEAQVAAIRGRMGAEYQRQLKATGLTEDVLRREVRDNIRIQIYMNDRFSGAEPAARAQLVTDWIAGLRRRADVTVLYLGK